MRNNAGFTLVELMVAIVIMLIGLLGLMESVNIAMEHNMKNQMRNEVTRVAQDEMNSRRAEPFGNFTATRNKSVASRLRGINRTYTVKSYAADIPNTKIVSKKCQVDVKWKYKNYSTTHSIMTIRSNAE